MFRFTATALTFAALLPALPLRADDTTALVDKAADFLRGRQGEDGSFSPRLGGPGVTALVVAGLLRNGRAVDDPVIVKALAYLEKSAKADGGIYDKGLANYTTSVAILALKEANKGGKYDTILANAGKYLKSLQGGDESLDQKDLRFGGVGYDGKGRPDLSNTHFFVEAMLAAGVSKDDPAVKNALRFIGRCQNLPGESNDQPYAIKTTPDDKGGFVYNPSDQSKKDSPHRTPDGGLRSVGTMTYAGLKSFIYAGVDKDDKRVKAALDWIGRHYTLTENPGQQGAGLFYYYTTFAKALDALGEPTFTDVKGEKHNWRQDLLAELKKRQKADGSWANENGAFMENNPDLATAYALIALSYTGKK